VRELAATAVVRSYSLWRSRDTGKLRVVKKLHERTYREVAAKDQGFRKAEEGRLELHGHGPCGTTQL
jgi:hypothetical protein